MKAQESIRFRLDPPIDNGKRASKRKLKWAKVGQNVKKDKKGFAIFSNMFDGAVARLSCACKRQLFNCQILGSQMS